ncbi:indolepyruvate ferredoxin oxidoreductase subunit alpha [Candidatus Parcubacteria bacterium]|nr:indolepyruvate ferredoxin oxidoreductase subunit alpha [Candidatus Parcubacteria bacterium]
MEEILENKQGKEIMLLGNEAIVRGALEAGVQFVSTYPGTPASEIGNTFYKIAKKAGVVFEFSTNEKTAMEAAAGASFCGLRTLVAMKNFGLNVASDFLLPLVYTGIKGGMVILIADDPSCWSSAQSEENTRGFASLSHIPILEPSFPQECKDFTKFAFELSEKFKIPIMIRETTRVSHQSAPVVLEKIKKGKIKAKFVKNVHQFSTMPPRVLEMHQELLEKIEKIREFSEKSTLNKIKTGDPTSFMNKGGRVSFASKVGIIASGASYLYVMEALKELNISLPVLKLGFFHPLPNKKIQKFIGRLKKVLIVEELDPYLEREIEILARKANSSIEIFGKNVLPEVGELKPEYVISAISEITGKKVNLNFQKHIQKFKKIKLAKRHPNLCPGCPYWFVFSAVKKAAPKGTIFGGGIGCYMLAGFPPHNIQDYLYCMGSSIGIAHGIKRISKQKLITFIGDSSFFHSGIPALINTIFNKSNPLIIIMNNSTTAMTGQQPHPGGADTIKIENIVSACGVKSLKVIDPINTKEMEKTIKEFLNKKEVSVIIARRPCVRLKT